MITPYFVIIPLAAAFLIPLVSKRKTGPAVLLSLASTFALVVLSGYAFFGRSGETLVYRMSGWKLPVGINLVQDAFSSFMLVMVSLIALTSLVFSPRYIDRLGGDAKYYSLFMVLVAGMNGVVVTGDLFNLFVFMEIAILAALALVAYGGRAHEFEAAFKYAVMASVSASLILIGIAVAYSATSSLGLATISRGLERQSPILVLWVGGLFMAGFGLKTAAMPFHAWLPDAHSSAPAPISAMLSGVLIKALGVYVLIRFFYNVLGAPPLFLQIFLVLGAVSIILGVLLAIGQWDIKRLLAYHSISQIGYILLAMGLDTTLGMIGAVYHMLNHAVFKSLLFYNAGALETALGTRDLREMGNVSKLLPVTSGTSLIASLSISGVPPFNGFFSKLVIIIAAVQAGQPLFAFVAVVGSLLTLASFLKVQKFGLRGGRPVERLIGEVDGGMKTAMILLAALCLVTSLLIVPGIRETTIDPVVKVIMEKTGHAQIVLEK
ncbi:MAG: NADH/ubiquinone/plastoquinone (complex I) [Candidatus Aminicenantes bacterium]|nr:NADH/ubiquinone/plastoquinone (complex I) [Candidatus Aminicenantes bacterium]